MLDKKPLRKSRSMPLQNIMFPKKDWVIDPYTPPPPPPLRRTPAILHPPKKRFPTSKEVIAAQRVEKEKHLRLTREEQKVKEDRDEALEKLTAGRRSPAPVDQALYLQLLKQMHGDPTDVRATPDWADEERSSARFSRSPVMSNLNWNLSCEDISLVPEYQPPLTVRNETRRRSSEFY